MPIPDDRDELTYNQKLRILWEDRGQFLELVRERNDRRARDEYASAFKRTAWQYVLGTGTVIGILVALNALGVWRAIRVALAP